MRRPRTAQALRGQACTMCDIIRFGYFRQVRFLLQMGVNLECREAVTRYTPLMLCALMEPPEWGSSVAMTLIEAGAKPGRTDAAGRNVLHLACVWARPALVKVLLRAIDFDVGAQDKDGNTALHMAAMSGSAAVTQLVTRAYTRYCVRLDKSNIHGMIACDEALQAGHNSCVNIIQLAGTGRQTSTPRDVHFADEPDRLSPNREENGSGSLRATKIPGVEKDTPAKNYSKLYENTSESDVNIMDISSGGLFRELSHVTNVATYITSPDVDIDFQGFTKPFSEPKGFAAQSSEPSPQEAVHTVNSKVVNRSPRVSSASILTHQETYTDRALVGDRSVVSTPRSRSALAFKRKSKSPLYLYGYKRDCDAIQCAPESDFRNTPEFVSKIAHLNLDSFMVQVRPLMDTTSHHGPWARTGRAHTHQTNHLALNGWRQELKSLFVVYEHQCSSSWRSGIKPECRPVTPDPTVQEEWDKGKRGRRQSLTSKEKAPAPVTRRPSVNVRPSKRSGSVTSGNSQGGDGPDGGSDPWPSSPTPSSRGRPGLLRVPSP